MTHYPTDIYTGFVSTLATPEMAKVVDTALAEAEAKSPRRWGTHPSLSDRFAAFASIPEPAGRRADDRVATALLVDAEGTGAAIMTRLSERVREGLRPDDVRSDVGVSGSSGFSGV